MANFCSQTRVDPSSFQIFQGFTKQYVKEKYPDIIEAINYAVEKSDTHWGLAVRKPIYELLLDHGYQDKQQSGTA